MYFIIIILAVFGAFWGAVCIVKLGKKCDWPTAIETVLNRLTGKVHIPLTEDEGLWSEIWAAIRNIIGDARFEKLRRTYEALAVSLGGIKLSGHHSGVPYIAIIIDPVDDAERRLLEAVIVGIVKRHLIRTYKG